MTQTKPTNQILFKQLFVVPTMLALLLSCNDTPPFRDLEVSTIQGSQTAEQQPPPLPTSMPEESDGDEGWQPLDPSLFPDSNAENLERNQENHLRESFYYGGNYKSPLVDYLFVVDNSCSMEGIGEKITRGFLSITQEGVLPVKAKVAVMNTMHGDPLDLNQPGIGINRYPGVESEPGFLDFVHRSAILNYRQMAPQFANRWPLNGCQDQWFSPNARSPEGDYCLMAATQSSHTCIGAEAGIHAFSQMMQKFQNADQRFRDGAVVNVIFVSDTHDPGTEVAIMDGSRPQYRDLQDMIMEQQKVSGLKFHALAPDRPCTTEGVHDLSYLTLSSDSQGTWENPCNLEDYRSFMRRMVEASQIATDAVFTLSHPIKSMISVKINGKTIEQFRVILPKVVIIEGLSLDRIHQIEIEYETDDTNLKS